MRKDGQRSEVGGSEAERIEDQKMGEIGMRGDGRGTKFLCKR
jgi:hypothetical protein